MKPSQKPAFTKVTECPECGASLKITNTLARVARECSEDWRHYLVTTPVPVERKHLILVTRPKAAQPVELTYEPDDTELAERAAIQAEALGIEFDDEGEITFVPPGVPDDVYEAVWRMQPSVLRKRQEQHE
jgi:hypothetical protein